MKSVLLKNVLFTLVAPGTVVAWFPLLLLPRLLWAPMPLGPLRYLGLLPVGLGAWIYFLTVRDFGRAGGTPSPTHPTTEFVSRGLYRWVRNPMYWGILLLLAGEALLLESRAHLGYAAAMLMFNLFIVLYEEPTLRKRFGASYVEYCRTVGRWIPRRPRASTPSSGTGQSPSGR